MSNLTLCGHTETLCVDCDNTSCLHAGNPGADCPKHICDQKGTDCRKCNYIQEYIRIRRNEFRKNA